MISIEEKALDVSLMKLENYYESAIESFEISMLDSSVEESFMEFTFDDFKNKVIELGKKVMEALKKFLHEVSLKIDTKIQQMQLNKKFEELKDMLAKKRAKAMGSTFTFVDVRKYKNYYKKFINTYVAELKRGLNKDFKSVEEFEKWKNKMTNDLCEFNYTLTDKERWTLSSAVNDAVQLTEEEIKNKNQSLKQIKDDTASVIDDISKSVISSPTMKTAMDTKDKAMKIFSGKQSVIGFVISKIGQCVKTLVSFVTKHTFACITGLIVFLIAL